MPSLNDLKVVISTQADTKGISETETALGGLSTKTAAIMGAMAGVAQNLVFQGINLITSSIGDAAKRVDTLNNASRTFENMGFSAQATKIMMHDLDMSIRGLPTSLSDAVTNVELLTGSTQDIGQSRKIFDALNDGILGFGGSAAQVNGAVIQLSQAFSSGKVDAQTWNSLIQNGMGPALDAIEKKLGLAKGTLKDAMSTGKVSVGEFQNALIELDTKGGGGLSSLQKIAHDSTAGMTSGMDNAKIAVTRGIAAIMTAIGSGNISEAISNVGKAFEMSAKQIAGAITTIIGAIRDANKYYQDHHRAINDVVNAIAPLVVALGTIKIAFAVWDAFKELQIILTVFRLVTLPSLIASLQATWAILMANPIILIVAAIAVAAFLIITHWNTVKNALISAWQEVSAVFSQVVSNMKQWIMDAINFIRNNWQMIVGFIVNPIGTAAYLVLNHFFNVKAAASDAVRWISGVFSAVGGAILSPFQWAYNAILNLFRGLPGQLGGLASSAAHSLTSSISGALHSLHIPGFATGVTNFSGGMALVGENGPELVSLPRGSSVYTNGQSKGMAGGSSMHTETHIYGDIHLGDASAVETFFAKIDQDTKLASRGMTGNRGIR